MITSVNYVLIGSNVPASYSNLAALSAGDVFMEDEKGALITSKSAAAAAKKIRFGVKRATDKYEYSPFIVAGHVQHSNFEAYTAPTQEVATIALKDAVIKAGNRYVIRIVYKDLYEAPGQFTHTYEVVSALNSADNTSGNYEAQVALVNAFVAKINAHKNRRVNAAAVAVSGKNTSMSLTAMEKDDNEGVNSLNQYSVVSMAITMYTTAPDTKENPFAHNYAEAVGVISFNNATPGQGYWKQVRDIELSNMGYKGHVFMGSYPTAEQDRKVVAGATYDTQVVYAENPFLSADNQYVKNTPIQVILFAPSNATSTLDAGVFASALAAFVAHDKDTTYTAGTGINISNANVISVAG